MKKVFRKSKSNKKRSNKSGMTPHQRSLANRLKREVRVKNSMW